MLKRICLYIKTLNYVTAQQFFYRIKFILNYKFFFKKYPLFVRSNPQKIVFKNNINHNESYIAFNNENKYQYTFFILGKKKVFKDNIDWDYNKYGKLWTYNLNYFEFLNQNTDVLKEHKSSLIFLIHNFVKNIYNIKTGLEPYPISIRGINWIKFLVREKIINKDINDCLYAQYQILLDNIEYHITGNHLLENGFSLVWSGVYFNDLKFLNKGILLLYQELNKQILNDGAHYELAPMYHKLILFRLLDAINLLKSNNIREETFLSFLEKKAAKMLSWINQMKIDSDLAEVPFVNDYISDINNMLTVSELNKYAFDLNIKYDLIPLKESGYRNIKRNNYQCIVDIGPFSPKYISGHSHADTFNFILYIDKNPFIVDTGTSSYEDDKFRKYERGTKAHNTVEVNNTNSSEAWSIFRTANRAKVIETEEKEKYIKAKHDGYKKFNVYHTREWKFLDNKIVIKDTLNKKTNAVCRLHFAPNVSEKEIFNRVKLTSNLENVTMELKKCFIAVSYEKRVKANVLILKFDKELEFDILTK